MALNLSPGADNAIMRNHLKRITRFFKGVYMPHHEQALLVRDMFIPDGSDGFHYYPPIVNNSEKY